MGLALVPLICAIFLFAQMNPLVVMANMLAVSVTYGLAFPPPTGINSIGDVFLLVVFVPKGVGSKSGRLIKIFCRSES